MSSHQGTRTSASASGKGHTSQETSKTTRPDRKVSPGTKRPAEGNSARAARGGKKPKKKEIKAEDEEEEGRVKTSAGQRPKNSKRRSVASKVSYKEDSNSEGEAMSDDDDFQATSEEDTEDSEDEAKPRKGKMGTGKSKLKDNNKNTTAPKGTSGVRQTVKDEEGKTWEEGEGSDEEGITKTKTERRGGNKMKGPGDDEWLEVYVEKTSSWVCVDVEHGVGYPQLCFKNATAPVTYVVSVDGEGFVKDLGRKYDPNWMTSSRRRRVDEDWWEETLAPFLGPEDERNKKEEKEVR